MKLTITLEHWNKAKHEDAVHAGMGRVNYCPIWQCLSGDIFGTYGYKEREAKRESERQAEKAQKLEDANSELRSDEAHED